MHLSKCLRSFPLLLPWALAIAVLGQTPLPDNRPRNCSIQGRVTLSGQPVANVQVLVFEIPANWNSPMSVLQTANGSISRTTFKTRTDGEGRYQITNLPPGRYGLRPASRAFVQTDRQAQQDGLKVIALDAGETRENVNFALVRGGVITGQVTDAEGRPAIALGVRLLRVTTGPDGQPRFHGVEEGPDGGQTDDRGVYRIYGLPAGSYIVGAGGEDDFFAALKYPRTFYPDAPNEKQAKTIEVKAGGEVSGINLRLGVSGKTFEARGRVIEAETGKPIPNVQVFSTRVSGGEEGDNGISRGSDSHARTDRLGNFRLTGLANGKHRAGISPGWMEQLDYYTEPATFDITGGDASGVEIKAIRGGVLSGMAVVEGSGDPAIRSKLTRVEVYAYTEQADSPEQPSSHHRTFIKPDGSFSMTGVAPGKVKLGAHGLGESSILLTRMERQGVEIKDFIEVSPGEKITDLRLIFTAGSGVIRGHVQNVTQLPAGATYYIHANLIANRASRRFSSQVDDKGRFELTRLPAGEYELLLTGHQRMETGVYEARTLVKQRVTVAANAEVQVTLSYDPNRKPEEER